MQAGVILASYHSLCGLVFGLGLKADIDLAMSFEKKCNRGYEDSDKKESVLT
jgi:hypothetical protein